MPGIAQMTCLKLSLKAAFPAASRPFVFNLCVNAFCCQRFVAMLQLLYILLASLAELPLLLEFPLELLYFGVSLMKPFLGCPTPGLSCYFRSLHLNQQIFALFSHLSNFLLHVLDLRLVVLDDVLVPGFHIDQLLLEPLVADLQVSLPASGLLVA